MFRSLIAKSVSSFFVVVRGLVTFLTWQVTNAGYKKERNKNYLYKKKKIIEIGKLTATNERAKTHDTE